MKLNSLQSLRELKEIDDVPQLKSLFTTRAIIAKGKLSEIELILHSTNLCYFTMRLLRDEIYVNNRDKVLNMAMQEVNNINALLSKSNYDEETTLSHKEVKETFKRLGVKPKHIKI